MMALAGPGDPFGGLLKCHTALLSKYVGSTLNFSSIYFIFIMIESRRFFCRFFRACACSFSLLKGASFCAGLTFLICMH